MHPQSPETEIELQPHKQKSIESEIAAATNSCGTDIQSTGKSTKYYLCDTVIIIIVLTLMHCR